MKFRLENIIQKDFPFLKDAKLLVTVSGGIDSVILTHLLHQLGYTITIAHCNFCLRGIDSDKDQQFVKETASNLNIPFYVTHFNTKEHAKQHKLSIQEAARNLRYDWFEKIRKQHHLDYILTAHNLNDNLETFLINLTRGTGLKGLTGILNINKKIIRPISSFTRQEIIQFATINNIKWREDKSNTDIKYTRNKIRHQVIPILEEVNPNLLESFKQTLKNLQGSKDIVQDVVDKVVGVENKQDPNNKINYKKDKVTENKQPVTFQIQYLTAKIKTNPKAYIHEIFSPYGFTNTKDIINLLSAQSGKQVFSKTHRLVKDRELLLLVKKQQETEIKKQDSFEIAESDLVLDKNNFRLQLKTIIGIPLLNDRQNSIQINKSLLKFPLTVRKWQNGDYFYPIGMEGKKKLSKYFKDEKLSLLEKENIWVLLSDNKIVWVIGKRQDKRFIVTKTTNILTLSSF